MDYVILAGVIVTLLGLAGLIWCMAKAYKAKKSGLENNALTEELQKLVAVNLGAFFLSAIGLALVVIGIVL